MSNTLNIKIIDGREAILLQKVKDGLPFIPEDNVVYQIDMWEVIYLDTMSTGIEEVQHAYENSYIPSGYRKYETKTNMLVDKFLKIHGIEIY